ncbi:MAG: hypothetical protein GWN00_04840, partial [Aliifodinibius sp.]|nr:hypothetical protein [candidate division Zixibacteria bacterium]NIT55570.1 hypothetical protein [Fodinibius sp.]NIR62949.1 hypothetical protein [candidate division Zixibacteria bacterium]NIS44961.1 hypothetical protein [candidate division Zixibacteria bacterium]NIU13061.1 hypothetical protein [candidate division Zixibacteria bacterium]
MAKLLHDALADGIQTKYIRRLLAVFSQEGLEKSSHLKMRDNDVDWVEPLSEREIEV